MEVGITSLEGVSRDIESDRCRERLQVLDQPGKGEHAYLKSRQLRQCKFEKKEAKDHIP